MSLSDCRTLLGAGADSLTGEELLTVRDDLYELSDVVADAYLDLQDKAGDLEHNEAAIRYGALRIALGFDEFEKENIEEDWADEGESA